MVRAGVGVSTHPEPRAAAAEAAAAAREGAGRPQAALLFATPAHGPAMGPLLDAAAVELGTRALVGASAHGVLGAGREQEGGHAVAILALEGLDAEPFLVPDLAGDEAAAAEEVAARLGGDPRPEDLVVLLPDPGALRPGPLLDALRATLGPARVVGAGAADPASERPLQWCGRELASGALAGIALRGQRPVRVGVTQACRPVTPLLAATRVEGHWIYELDGRPALDAYREAARGPLAEDLRRAAAFVLVALPCTEGEPLEPGGYRVRNVAGFALRDGALALPEPLAPGDRIAFAVREPATAREDLKAMIAGLSGTPPALGLYFDCCARGAAFFGVSGLEAGYLESAFGAAPIAGMFGSCELGPVGGRLELLTYTGVLALVDG